MSYWRQALSDWNYIFREELRTIVRDQGVLIFFFIVPLGYPLLYTFIYNEEVVREVPVVVVDDCRSALSREYARNFDASPDVSVISYAANMEEAKQHVKHREAYGIVHIPADFSRRIVNGEQAYVGAYADMSGMLYYKSVLTANTNVSLKLNARIKVEKAGNLTAEQDRVTEHPITYEEVSLYNPQNGFATFLIPAVLILIIQQTLLLGVGMAAGTAREHNRFRNLLPVERHHTGLLRIVQSKALAYLLVYIPISIYVLGVVPRLFSLNQIGDPRDMALFVLPFLLACIFFAMTVSAFVRNREMCIMLIVFTSVPLLFSLGWLKVMRWNVYKLIAAALFVFMLYVGGFYFLVDESVSIAVFRLPLVFRGFSYAVLSIAFMWSLNEMLSFQHFFQALSVFNMLHMFVGGLIGGALHGHALKYYMADGFARYGQHLDAVSVSAGHVNFGAFLEHFVEGLMAQSVKILFGWTLFAAMFLFLLMLLWDIPSVRRRVKRIPEWPKVGVGVWNGYRRQQRLHRLRKERRLRAVPMHQA